MYELEIPNQRRDEPQPRIILLESQLKQHHFLHWTWPGPTVTFQVRKINCILDIFVHVIN